MGRWKDQSEGQEVGKPGALFEEGEQPAVTGELHVGRVGMGMEGRAGSRTQRASSVAWRIGSLCLGQ